MAVSVQLSPTGRLHQRSLFKNCVVSLDKIHDLRFQYHKSGVDPATVLFFLFFKVGDRSVLRDIQDPKTSSRLRRCDRRHLSVRSVILQKLPQVHIRHSVSVSQHKGVSVQILLHPLDSASCHCLQPCVHKRYLPGLQYVVMDDHFIFLGKIKGNIAVVKIIIREPFLDHMLLVAAADYKLMKSIAGIHFHNVPQNRLFTYFDHGLRFQMTLLADPGPKSSRQNNNLHMFSPFKKNTYKQK